MILENSKFVFYKIVLPFIEVLTCLMLVLRLNYLIIKSLIMSKSYKFTIVKRKNNSICDVVKEIDVELPYNKVINNVQKLQIYYIQKKKQHHMRCCKRNRWVWVCVYWISMHNTSPVKEMIPRFLLFKHHESKLGSQNMYVNSNFRALQCFLTFSPFLLVGVTRSYNIKAQ